MQDKIKKIFIQASIFTTDPDKDWRRLFIGLMGVMLSVSVWSFYFYTQINQDIQISEINRPKNTGSLVVEQGDELHRLVLELETKKTKNEAVVRGEYLPSILRIVDPSR
jgi:hypothetical protein